MDINSLNSEISALKDLCSELIEIYGSSAVELHNPCNPEMLNEWEVSNSIAIPAQLKEFLLFSDGYDIFSERLMPVGNFIADHPDFPETLVIIGQTHDESLCFSKTDGRIIRYGVKETRSYDDFKAFLNETLIRSLKKEI